MRVLIIDDDEDLHSLLSHYIGSQWPAAKIDHYNPLEKAMPQASFPLGSYNVVVLDYMLGRFQTLGFNAQSTTAMIDYLRSGNGWTGSDAQLQQRVPGLTRLIVGAGEYQFN